MENIKETIVDIPLHDIKKHLEETKLLQVGVGEIESAMKIGALDFPLFASDDFRKGFREGFDLCAYKVYEVTNKQYKLKEKENKDE